MAIISKEIQIGARIFLIGVILSVIIGLSTTLLPIPYLVKYSSAIYAILVIFGLFVGFLSVDSKKKSQAFMTAGTVLVIVSKFGMESVTGSLIGIGIGDAVTSVFAALLTLFVPATIVVAIKNLFSIAKI